MAEFEALEQDLSSPLPAARQRAVVGLVEKSDLRALPLLEHAAENDPNTKVRFYAKRGLLLLRQRGSSHPLASGVQAVGEAQTADPAKMLQRWRTLGVEDRIRAIQRLSISRDNRLLAVFASLLKSEQEAFVRSKLVVSLGIFGNAAALPLLKTFLSDPDARVRANAVEAIGYVGGEEALPLLFAALVSTDSPRLVRNVGRFLDRGNEALFFRFLDRTVRNSRSNVREAVLKAVLLLQDERLYGILAVIVKIDDGIPGKQARTALQGLAQKGVTRATELLARLDGTRSAGADTEPLQPRAPELSEAQRIEALTRILATADAEIVPRLTLALRNEPNPKIRSLLLRGLISLGGDSVVPTLLGLLSDSDARVRADIIEVLYPYATHPNVARRIPEMLKDPSGRVRANALVLLGRIPGMDIQKPLGDLATSEDAQDRLRAIYVVLDVERDDATLLAAPLLLDDDENVRARAREVLQLLGERGNATAVKLLSDNPPETGTTLDLDPDEEETAEHAILQATEATEATEVTLPAPPPLPPRVSRPEDPASDASIEKDRLVYMLDSDDDAEKVKALRILEEIGDDQAMEPVRRLTNDRSDETRHLASRVLRTLKDRFGSDGSDPTVEPSEDEVEKLRMRLCHRDQKVRLAALKQISPAHRELREFLLERIESEEDTHVRSATVLAAGILSGPSDLRAIVPSLSDLDGRVRANAIEALEYAGDVSTVRLISPSLSDEAARASSNAAKALHHFDRDATLKELREAMKARESWVRYGAVQALRELGGTEILDILYEQLPKEKNLQVFVTSLAIVCAVPAEGRKEKLKGMEGEISDTRKAEWLAKAIDALDSGEFNPAYAGAEGAIARLKPTAEEMMGLLAPPEEKAETEAAEKSAQENKKLIRIVAHLREDLYAQEAKIRQEAAVRLGKVEHPAAIRALSVALSHSDTVVRYLARRSLKGFLDRPGLFETHGDMTHRAVKAAVSKSERTEGDAGPPRGDFRWAYWWVGILMFFFLLYAVFFRGGAEEPIKKRPTKRGTSRQSGPRRPRKPDLGGQSKAGQVNLGPRDRGTARGGDEPAAGIMPDERTGGTGDEGSSGSGVRPEDYPQEDRSSGSERPPDPDAFRDRDRYRGSTAGPDMSAGEERRERY